VIDAERELTPQEKIQFEAAIKFTRECGEELAEVIAGLVECKKRVARQNWAAQRLLDEQIATLRAHVKKTYG
jgi:hypothetical protein